MTEEEAQAKARKALERLAGSLKRLVNELENLKQPPTGQPPSPKTEESQ